MSETTSVGVHVYVRFRPLNDAERDVSSGGGRVSLPTFDIGGVGVLQSNKNAPFTYDGGKVHDKKRGYEYSKFDKVMGPGATQPEAYENIVQPLLADVLCGYNAGVFAYGQSGGGKTYTMLGCEGALTGDLRGMIPRTIDDLFATSADITSQDRLLPDAPENVGVQVHGATVGLSSCPLWSPAVLCCDSCRAGSSRSTRTKYSIC